MERLKIIKVDMARVTRYTITIIYQVGGANAPTGLEGWRCNDYFNSVEMFV